MTWTVSFNKAAAKELKHIDKMHQERILRYLQDPQILETPRCKGKALKGKEYGSLWRYRVGSYRVICDLKDQELIILVVKSGSRGSVY